MEVIFCMYLKIYIRSLGNDTHDTVHETIYEKLESSTVPVFLLYPMCNEPNVE